MRGVTMAMAGCSVLSPTFLDCSNLNLASVPNYINFGKYEMVSFQGNSIIHGDVSNFPFSKFDFRNQRVEFNCDLIKYADSQIIFPCQPNGKRDRDDEQKEEEERKKKERKKREREDEDRDSKRRRRLWVKVIIPWVFVSVMVVSLAGVIAYKVAQYVKKNRQRGRHHFYAEYSKRGDRVDFVRSDGQRLSQDDRKKKSQRDVRVTIENEEDVPGYPPAVLSSPRDPSSLSVQAEVHPDVNEEDTQVKQVVRSETVVSVIPEDLDSSVVIDSVIQQLRVDREQASAEADADTELKHVVGSGAFGQTIDSMSKQLSVEKEKAADDIQVATKLIDHVDDILSELDRVEKSLAVTPKTERAFKSGLERARKAERDIEEPEDIDLGVSLSEMYWDNTRSPAEIGSISKMVTRENLDPKECKVCYRMCRSVQGRLLHERKCELDLYKLVHDTKVDSDNSE